MHNSLASNSVACADSSAVTSNILRCPSRTALTRSMVDNSAAGAAAGASSFSVTGVSSAGVAAVAVNDDPADRELAGVLGGFVLLDVFGLPLGPEGVRFDEGSLPRFV